ncbi:hypothetical protein AAC387_Pa05g1779 [Persea americana]
MERASKEEEVRGNMEALAHSLGQKRDLTASVCTQASSSPSTQIVPQEGKGGSNIFTPKEIPTNPGKNAQWTKNPSGGRLILV